MPLISVVIPTFSRVVQVRETIASALAQEGFSDFEVIVVDDGSTDGTEAMLREWGNRIRVVRQDNAGLGAARNAGIAAASGTYIALLDDDDLWAPWMLRTFARAIQDNASPWLISASAVEFMDGTPPPQLDDDAYHTTAYANLFAAAGAGSYWIVPSGACFRRDIARQLGGFFTYHINHEENDMWLRAGDQPGFVRLDRPMSVLRRVHTTHLSGRSDRNYSGTAYLIAQERRGAYPGGDRLARQRQSMIAAQVRPVAVACARNGALAYGWRLYRDTLRWNLAGGRLRFLLGWPVVAAMGATRELLGRSRG